MSVIDLAGLKAALADVAGIESLTETVIGGRRVFGFNGLIAAVDLKADAAAIVAAIRNAVGLRNAAAPAAAPLAAQPTNQPQGKPMSVTGTGNTSMSLKAMIEAQKARVQQGVQDSMKHIQSGFDKQNDAVKAMGVLGDKVHAEADDLMATVGEFTNDLLGEGK